MLSLRVPFNCAHCWKVCNIVLNKNSDVLREGRKEEKERNREIVISRKTSVPIRYYSHMRWFDIIIDTLVYEKKRSRKKYENISMLYASLPLIRSAVPSSWRKMSSRHGIGRWSESPPRRHQPHHYPHRLPTTLPKSSNFEASRTEERQVSQWILSRPVLGRRNDSTRSEQPRRAGWRTTIFTIVTRVTCWCLRAEDTRSCLCSD